MTLTDDEMREALKRRYPLNPSEPGWDEAVARVTGKTIEEHFGEALIGRYPFTANNTDNRRDRIGSAILNGLSRVLVSASYRAKLKSLVDGGMVYRYHQEAQKQHG